MKCPYCSAEESRVVDSRDARSGTATRRRRECASCGERFTTYERTLHPGLEVRKRDGRIEPFQREKMAAGLNKAFEKRPVTVEQLETMAEEVEEDVRSLGQKIVDSRIIGEHLCERIREVDEVAYLRFASVYKEFSHGEHFLRELKVLQNQRG